MNRINSECKQKGENRVCNGYMPLYANMLCKKPHTHTNKGNGNNQKYFKLFSVTIIGGNRIGVTYIIRSKVNGQ